MERIIIEIKAKTDKHEKIREFLKKLDADFKGTDKQTDTYFQCDNGRLKLREGIIENHLIHYNRPNDKGPKKSDVLLYTPGANEDLKQILERAFGVKVVVKKIREIYFVDNIKIHLDYIKGLGTFVEIEAIGRNKNISVKSLRKQCEDLIREFEINEDDLVDVSYSDMSMNYI